jgi:pyridoxal 5'-phosphate synthase pdxT subunit
MTKKIGVLAMQGAFRKHLEMLKKTRAEALEVRTSADLDSVDALIIPGGESTVIGKLLVKNSIINPLIERVKSGMALYGTCAGMILMAETIEGDSQPHLSLMDITVKRNAYGRQKESFEASFNVKGLGDDPYTGIFIRSPKITGITGNVEVLAEFEGVPVLVREGRLLASSFHPELTEDTRIHELFLSMI